MANGNGGFWSDFRKFILRGNVVDLAVAVIIGGAFGKIIESFVADVITPAILSPALKAANVDDLQSLSANGIKYGSFLASVLNFLVIALSIFILVRSFEKAQKKLARQEAVAAVETAPDPAVVLQERTISSLDRLAQALESRNL
jgi:large conductance mechanosensitive channel